MSALQDDSGLIRAKLLAGDPAYKLSAMYVEFENVASPGDAVTPPSPVPATDGIDYYQNTLTPSINRDFIRVPIAFPGLVETDATLYAAPNKLTLIVNVPAGTGYHGKPFNSGANSKVFGIAVVVTPVWADPLQDLVYSRQYYATGSQMVIGPSGVLTITFVERFPVS